MGKKHRLRPLKMRIARDHGLMKPFCDIDQSRLQVAGKDVDLIRFFAKPKPKCGCDLVIAAAASVELAACIADGFDQLCLDKRVNIFSARALKIIRMERRIRRKLRQPADDRIGVLPRDHPRTLKPESMGNAPADIRRKKPPIKTKRIVELGKDLVRLFSKSPAPEIFRFAHISVCAKMIVVR